jgi:hypothetical protein
MKAVVYQGPFRTKVLLHPAGNVITHGAGR